MKSISIMKSLICDDGQSAYDKGYRSLKELSEKFNIKPSTLSRRYRRDGERNFEDFIRPVGHKAKMRRFFIGQRKLAIAFGVRPDTYRNRRSNLHWSVLQSLEPHGYADCYSETDDLPYDIYVFEGITFNSIDELSQYMRINVHLLKEKLRAIETLKEADKINAKPIQVFGINFKSRKEFADHCGLPYSKVRRLLRSGVAPEEIPEWQNKKNCGYYSEGLFQKNPELAEAPGLLYLVIGNYKKQDLIKVGITCGDSLEKRALPFSNKDILLQCRSSLRDVASMEQDIISWMRSNLTGCGTIVHFDGYHESTRLDYDSFFGLIDYITTVHSGADLFINSDIDRSSKLALVSLNNDKTADIALLVIRSSESDYLQSDRYNIICAWDGDLESTLKTEKAIRDQIALQGFLPIADRPGFYREISEIDGYTVTAMSLIFEQVLFEIEFIQFNDFEAAA